MEGKLGDTDVQISYHCNRLCVTLALSGVYINRRVLFRRTIDNHTIGYLLGFSLSDLVVDQLL